MSMTDAYSPSWTLPPAWLYLSASGPGGPQNQPPFGATKHVHHLLRVLEEQPFVCVAHGGSVSAAHSRTQLCLGLLAAVQPSRDHRLGPAPVQNCFS